MNHAQRLYDALCAQSKVLGRRLTKGEYLEVFEREIALIVKEVKPVRKPKEKEMTDDEWVSSLEKDEAFLGLDVKREILKCSAWYRQNVSKTGAPTRRRIINWLLKAERVVELKKSGASYATGLKLPAPSGPEGWLPWLQTELSVLSEDHPAHGQILAAYNCRTFSMLPKSWQERANQQIKSA